MRGLGLGEAVAQSNACFSSNVTVPNTSADLIIFKTGSPAQVPPGGNITYQLRGKIGGMQGGYYSDQCAPGKAMDEHLSDSTWATH